MKIVVNSDDVGRCVGLILINAFAWLRCLLRKKIRLDQQAAGLVELFCKRGRAVHLCAVTIEQAVV